MKKYQIVKDKRRYEDIIKNGSFIKNNLFVIYNKESDLPYPRFGLAVGKKIGKAYLRNKIKRQVRMIITNNQNLFKNNKDYIIMIKKQILDVSYHEMENSLVDLINKEK